VSRRWHTHQDTFSEFNALVGLEKVREKESYYSKDLFVKLATEKRNNELGHTMG